jgi:putative CocE/NonD family hydrolase
MALNAADKRLRLPRRQHPTATPDRFPRCAETRGLMVPMRDGVRLATDVYRPADAASRAHDAPLPAILIRLPYGKDEPYASMPAHGRYWARKGYVCVVQDVRGKFASEGEWLPLLNEADDGYDTIDWIVGRPWSDGQVGMIGESYFALTQWAAASRFHTALRCIAPGCMGIDLYRLMYEGGALALDTTGTWVCDQLHRRDINYLRFDPWTLPLKDYPARAGFPSALFDQAVEHPDRDATWEPYDLSEILEKLDIPAYHWTGWFDCFLPASLATWRGVQERNWYDTVRENQWLCISPADHELTTEATGAAGRHALAGQGITNDRVLAFFDHWLRLESDGFGKTPRVRCYVVGADRWCEADEWPLPGTRFTTYHLRSGASDESEAADPQRTGDDGGGPGGEAGPGLLSPEPPGPEPPDAFTYNPVRPVDHWVGRPVWSAARHLDDRRRVVSRPDVLGYVTPPLAAPLEVVGPLAATLYVSTSAPDTDFTVTLVDIWPDGYAQLVQEGIRRLRYREGDGEHAGPPAVPGAVYELHIDMAATGYEFAAGHRVGVEVSSSSFDRWDRNPNTGHPPGRDAEIALAHQTVYHDAERPSHLMLPVAPLAARAEPGSGE